MAAACVGIPGVARSISAARLEFDWRWTLVNSRVLDGVASGGRVVIVGGALLGRIRRIVCLGLAPVWRSNKILAIQKSSRYNLFRFQWHRGRLWLGVNITQSGLTCILLRYHPTHPQLQAHPSAGKCIS